jgi:NAD(P)-dependent dehydrogenase (short-subunit alcohol dehydrogenase family)
MTDGNAADRVVMISGASRGIGRATAELLHRRGYTLSIGARSVDDLQFLGTERVLAHAYEATSETDASEWVDATIDRFGRIDILVNSAGVSKQANFENDIDVLREVLEINVIGTYRLINYALPHIRKSERGRIVNIASLSGLRYTGSSIAYSMSKFAQISMTHALRTLVWDDNVRVTAVAPGPVATDMVRPTRVAVPDWDKMTKPETVAHAVLTVIEFPDDGSISVFPINCRNETTV